MINELVTNVTTEIEGYLPIRAHFQNIPNSLHRIKKKKMAIGYQERQIISHLRELFRYMQFSL